MYVPWGMYVPRGMDTPWKESRSDRGRHKRLCVFWEGMKDGARSPAHQYARGAAARPAPLAAEASLVLVIFCAQSRASEPARADTACRGNGGETGGWEAFLLSTSEPTH